MASTYQTFQPVASTSYCPPAQVMPFPAMNSAALPSMPPPQNDKIQAYAALEFPSFNFYIKTMSVTIGRMPPMLVLPSGAVQSTSASHHPSGSNSRASSLNTMKPVADNSYFSPRLLPISATRSTSPLLGDAKQEVLEGDKAALLDQKDRPRSATPQDPPPAYSAQAPSIITKKEEVPAINNGDDVHVDVDLGPIKAVSRDHARCFYDAKWACWALEVKGRNGLVVEGRWRAKGDTVMLSHRMKIQIAEHIFYFVLPDSVVQTKQYSPYHSDSESSSDGEVKISDDDELESIADGASQSVINGLPKTTVPVAASKIILQHDIEPLSLDSISSAKPKSPIKPVQSIPVPQPTAGSSTEKPITVTVPPPPSKATKKETKKAIAAQAVASTSGTAIPVPSAKKDKEKDKDKDKEKDKDKPAKVPVKRPKGKRRIPAEGEPDLDPNSYTIWPLRKPSNEFVDGAAKPPYSFPSLIGQCMHYNNDKKLTSAVIQEWIANVYPWYDANRDKVGWLNSVQQHLSTNKGFVKTPRRSDEPGKGNFWVYDEAVNLVFDGISEDEDNPSANRPPAIPGVPGAPQPKKPPVARPPAAKSAANAKQTIKISAKPGTSAKPAANGKQPANAAARPNTTGKPPLPPNGKGIPPRPTLLHQQQANGQPIASGSGQPHGPGVARPAGVPGAVVHPVRIIVGPIPPTYKPPTPKPNAANDEVAAQLLKDPPIVLHEGALVLSPAIFGQMKPDQIVALSKLGAAKALSILQSYIVQHFKEKLKRNKARIAGQMGQPVPPAQPGQPSQAGQVPPAAATQATTETPIAKPPQAIPVPPTVARPAQQVPQPTTAVKRKLDDPTGPASPATEAGQVQLPVAKKQAL